MPPLSVSAPSPPVITSSPAPPVSVAGMVPEPRAIVSSRSRASRLSVVIPAVGQVTCDGVAVAKQPAPTPIACPARSVIV